MTTKATPEQALAYLGDLHNLEAFVEEVVAPAGDGARVRYVGTYELKGLSKVGGPFSRLLGQRSVKRVAERLKIRLDGLAAGPSS